MNGLRNNNNFYFNATEWLASPGSTKFSKPEEMSKKELDGFLKIFTRLRGREMAAQFTKVHRWNHGLLRATSDRFLRWTPHNKPFSIIWDPAVTEALANEVLEHLNKTSEKTGNNAGVVHVKPICSRWTNCSTAPGELGKAESKNPSQLKKLKRTT